MIMLGDRVRCKVTGLVGIAISRVEFLNRCEQICVKPPVDDDGKTRDGEYIDIHQLEVVEPNVVHRPDSAMIAKGVAGETVGPGGPSHGEHDLPR